MFCMQLLLSNKMVGRCEWRLLLDLGRSSYLQRSSLWIFWPWYPRQFYVCIRILLKYILIELENGNENSYKMLLKRLNKYENTSGLTLGKHGQVHLIQFFKQYIPILSRNGFLEAKTSVKVLRRRNKVILRKHFSGLFCSPKFEGAEGEKGWINPVKNIAQIMLYHII